MTRLVLSAVLVAAAAAGAEAPPPPPSPPPLTSSSTDAVPPTAEEGGPMGVELYSEAEGAELGAVGSKAALCRAPCKVTLDTREHPAVEVRVPGRSASHAITLDPSAGDVAIGHRPKNWSVWSTGLALTILGGVPAVGGVVALVGSLLLLGVQALFSGGGVSSPCCIDGIAYGGLAYGAGLAVAAAGVLTMVVWGSERVDVHPLKDPAR